MRIIIVGQGASGKDYFKNYLTDVCGLRRAVSTTTRDCRPDEVEGVNYHYVSEEKFLDMKNMGWFVEDCKFAEWRYGTAQDDWDSAEVFIMTPSGIAQLTRGHLSDSVVVFFDVDEAVRRERLMARNAAGASPDPFERRLSMDREQFAGFSTYDIKVTDPVFNPAEVMLMIHEVEISKTLTNNAEVDKKEARLQ